MKPRLQIATGVIEELTRKISVVQEPRDRIAVILNHGNYRRISVSANGVPDISNRPDQGPGQITSAGVAQAGRNARHGQLNGQSNLLVLIARPAPSQQFQLQVVERIHR